MMHINLTTRMTPLVKRALGFASYKHRHHLRKYTGEPYTVHLEAVADIVAWATDDEEVIAAALLHDTLEDTDTTFSELVKVFGRRVADLVREVTDVSMNMMENRATRKAADRKHLANASAYGQTIKLADLIDNTESITMHDPEFAKVYLNEKRLLLEVLTKGNPVLKKLAEENTRFAA